MKSSALLRGSRSRVFAASLLVIAAIFVARLFYLQIIQHNHYTALANTEQLKRKRIPAQRGEIYALNGESPVKLVMNETVYTAIADPSIIPDTKAVATIMKEIAGGNVRSGFESLLERKDTRYQVIANRLTRAQADKIKDKNLKGIGFQPVSQRVYPEGQLAAQVLGFVNTEGVGNYGLEGYLNQRLAGVDGQLETVTDFNRIPLTIGDRNIRKPAQNGENIVLTMDRNIQSKVEQALVDGAARTGATDVSAVVIDPNTGRVMAMANTPSYNPGQYYAVKDGALFNNKVISSPYEPGSDVKTYTMATAIDKGVASATDTFYNTDTITVEDRTIGNATRGKTGVISFQTALNWSLNTGFVTLAQRLGDGKNINRAARDTMYEYFHDRLRLGQLTGIELSNEQPGIIISPDDPDGNAVRYSNMSFGQGLDATMIQVVSGFSAIINGGTLYQPTMLAGKMVNGVFEPVEKTAPLATNVVKQTTSDQMKAMTHEARTSSFPTIDRGGYYVGGKTGTSQVVRNGAYSETESIGTYLGYGGGSAESPQYVIMVSISGKDKVMQGSRDAMPIFTDISNWMLDYLKIQPKG